MNASKHILAAKLFSNIHMKYLLTILSIAAIAGGGWSQAADADNAERNAEQSLAATDQSNDPADVKMTADIRKMVVNDDSLSMAAKNVKIITIAGVVTLRGPVNTPGEKSAIEGHAKHAGAKQITNELEIKKS